MTQHDDPTSGKGTLDDDLDVFEEFESGGGPDEVTDHGRSRPPEAAVPGGEEEFAGFEEHETTAKTAEQVAAAEAYDIEEPASTAARSLADELAELAPDVPVNLVAVVGKTQTTVGELIRCRVGQVIDLSRTPGETVDLVANGRMIARGELVEMDGKMGVRILKMVR